MIWDTWAPVSETATTVLGWRIISSTSALSKVKRPTVVVVPLALLFATLIHRGVWGGNGFRAVLLFPNLLGGIAATLLWMSAYEPNGGLVNAGLVALGQAAEVVLVEDLLP